MKTNYLILIIALIIFSSCNSGRYYANYRVGGKSKSEKNFENEEENSSNVLNEIIESKNDISLSVINVLDTFQIQSQSKINTLEKKEQVSVALVHHDKKQKRQLKKLFAKVNPIEKKAKRKTFTNNYSSKDNRLKKFLIIVLAAALIIGLSSFISLGTTFWITVGIILAAMAGFFLALYLFVGLFFTLLEEIFGSFSSLSFKSHKAFKNVNHGERIAALFWTLIGVVILGGIISAIVFIPNFLSIALIVLVALLTAALIGAVFAAFIDFIMPGDSLFSIKSKNRKLQNNISSLLKSIVELYSKFLNKEPLSTGQYILLFLTTLLVINLVMLFVFGLAVALEVAASILFFLAGITLVVLVTSLAMWLQPKHR